MVSESSSFKPTLEEMDSQQGASTAQRLSLLVLAVFAIAGLTSGCFITNCPPGGKRSDTAVGRIPIRQCSRCGYGGRCFGPTICCSPSSGCLVGDKSSTLPLLRPCAIEASVPGACLSGSKACGGRNGRCASDGICCDSVSCSTDPSCRISSMSLDSTYTEGTRSNALEGLSQLKDYSDGYGGLDGGLSRF